MYILKVGIMMKKIIYATGLSLTMALSACTDWLTVQPETSMTAETLFQTDNGVKYGLNGAYLLASQTVYGPSGYFGGLSAVENMANTYLYAVNTDGYNWANHNYEQTDSQKNVNGYTFQYPYKIIANLNSLLKEMEPHRDKITPEVYHMVCGEAFALRACCHFDLLRTYGPVPSQVDAGKTYLPYVRVNDVGNYEYHTFAQFMEYVQADLDSAEFLLSKYDPVLTTNISYTESTSYTWSYRKSRINYYGVLGLQARVALWIGEKEKALRYARLVKDAKDSAESWAQLQFKLTTPSDDVNSFTSTDLSHYSEHICGAKCETFDFSTSGWAFGRLSSSNDPDFGKVLYGEKYEEDLRYQHFWRTGSGTWYAPDGSILDKYKVTSITINKFSQFLTNSTSNCKDNFPIMRLPEIYFIIMECGTLDEANTLYQEYCAARNIEYVALTEGDRQERIMLESIREYVGEGQNFFTYKRNNVKRMIGATTDCSENQYIVPIPEAEYLDVK